MLKIASKFCNYEVYVLFLRKNSIEMYIIGKNEPIYNSDLSLSEMLSRFLSENDITDSAISNEIGVTRATLSKFLQGKADLKFMQAVRLMKILGIPEDKFVSTYCYKNEQNTQSFESLEKVSYIAKNFDIPALKKKGIISPRANVDEYEKSICDFLGIKSIYEYDDTTLMPVLFSKSKRQIYEKKESKMTSFWLRCSISSFNKLNNPNTFDKDLLCQILKRASEFTEDEKDGYYRFVLVLYQIGVTVITQSYSEGTNAYGCTMILDGKPCIVITDMGKKYHKLWLSLLHELYHVINDFDIIESISYHFSTPNNPDLLLNEQKADKFALDILINPTIQEKLNKIVSFPSRVKLLAKELHVSPSIIYGVYLESLPNGKTKSNEFAKYNNDEMLISSKIATKKILFDPISKRSLENAIEELKVSFNIKAV